MKLKSLLLATLLSLTSATPVIPVVRSLAPSKVVPRKGGMKLPYPTTFYDLPTGDPRSVPLPTGDLGSPPPPWRHEHGVGVYKDPNQIAPLWYPEGEEGWDGIVYPADAVGRKNEDPAPTEFKIEPRTEVATPAPVVVRIDTGFDDALSRVGTKLLSEGEMSACWNECRSSRHEACEQCDQKLRQGGLTPSNQPVRYDPWGWGPKRARDSVDTAAMTMAFEKLWKCAVNCMRTDAKPCTTCDALWEESNKIVSTRGFKEEMNFWVCVRDCSRDRLISCMDCEPAWRQQLAATKPNNVSVEQAAAYAEIWNCVVHCGEDKTQKMCTPCDELWRKWDAGLPPFEPEQAGLATVTARGDGQSPPQWFVDGLRKYLICREKCNGLEDTPRNSLESDYCDNCDKMATALQGQMMLYPRVNASMPAKSSKSIEKRLLYVWDPATGVFQCGKECAKGKDYYISCLPCLYHKGIPIDESLAEVVKTRPEQRSDVQARQ
ncbi:hypothetical protein J3E72DRAFT_369586 [Bipolaris maydis]|nr:hypothetical protein J3E72DRAFT_369586 [Bipolaris maydis]